MKKLDLALAQAALGRHVFPCNGKTPLTSHGFKDATIDVQVIKNWWELHPDANVAMATGKVSGIDVLDVDGAIGEQSLRSMGPLPETAQVKTPRGRHLWFKACGLPTKVGVMPGLDTRGDGGYVIVWEKPVGVIADVTLRFEKPVFAEPIPSTIPLHERNSTLASLAGSMRRRGASVDAIEAALIAENKKCVEMLPIREVQGIARSISRYTPAVEEIPAEWASAEAWDKDTEDLYAVEDQKIEWAIEPYLPRGELTILEGGGGLGKSTLSMAWAGKNPGNTLMWAREDRRSVLQERAALSGAKGRIFYLKFDPVFPEDCARLRHSIEKHQASLVIVDPITSRLGTRSLKDPQEARQAFEPLMAVAHDTNATIIAIRHWNKNIELPFDKRGQGGTAPFDVARVVNALVKSPSGDIVLISIKNNYVAVQDRLPRQFSIRDGVASVGMVSEFSEEEIEAHVREPSKVSKWGGKREGSGRSFKYSL